MQPFLNRDWDLVDVECGPAFIDYELLRMVRSITIIDDDAATLDFAREKISSELSAGNFEYERITPLDLNAARLEGRKWDVALFSFRGAALESLDSVIAMAERRAVLLVYSRSPDELFNDNVAWEMAQVTAASDVEGFLKQRSFDFHDKQVELQFGRPFKSIEDIHGFINAQSAIAGENDIDAVEQAMRIEERIVKTGRYDYPYYLPRNISVRIFIILKPV